MQTSKYLVANMRDAQWGLTVSTVGHEEIQAGDPYPTQGHADGYYFDTRKGRELNEYQLLYQPEGEGVFRSAHKEGKNIDDRVRAGFLSPEKPIYHVGYSSDIIRLYEEAYKTAYEEAAYSQQTLAGIVNHLIGLMYSLERNIILNREQNYVDMVNRARLRIRNGLEEELTIQRKLFKEFTGISPALYQQDLRLQRAKELLSTTDISIKEIAYRLNFESPDYFSSKFKIKTGSRPSEFRHKMR